MEVLAAFDGGTGVPLERAGNDGRQRHGLGLRQLVRLGLGHAARLPQVFAVDQDVEAGDLLAGVHHDRSELRGLVPGRGAFPPELPSPQQVCVGHADDRTALQFGDLQGIGARG